VADFLDEEPLDDRTMDASISAFLLLQLIEQRPTLDLSEFTSFHLTQLLSTIVRSIADSPTPEYELGEATEMEITERIRHQHDVFRSHELAARERLSIGHYLPMISEARRQLDFERARALAGDAFARAQSDYWKRTFQEQLTEIDREIPKGIPSLQRRSGTQTRFVPRVPPTGSQPAPLWQQASDASMAGKLDLAIEL
jgi:hypothetical protein